MISNHALRSALYYQLDHLFCRLVRSFVPTYKINDQVDNTMLILKHGWKSLKDPESSDYGYVHAEDDPRVDKALLSENVFRWWVNSDGVPIANRRLVMSNRGLYCS